MSDTPALTTTLKLKPGQMYTATVLVNSRETRTVTLLGDSNDPLMPQGPFVGAAFSSGPNTVETNLGTQTFSTESESVTVSVSAADPLAAIQTLSVQDNLNTQLVVVSQQESNVLFDDVLVIITGPL
jgi:hypothetical protein